MEAVGKYSSLIPLVKEASAEIQKEQQTIDARRKFEIEREAFIEAANKKAKEDAAAAKVAEKEAAEKIQEIKDKNQESLDKQIKQIQKQAQLEGKSVQSAEIQKKLLDARVSAYLSLIQEIGDAGEAEKRVFADLQAEYTQMELETANRLQEDNLKNLEDQKRVITEKAELEGRTTNSLETQRELLDAEVQSYGNQLDILRKLIDGTKEEETARRAALQASWDQYRSEQMTAEEQKRRLIELAKAQSDFSNIASSLYDTVSKEQRDRKDKEKGEQLLKDEKAALEQYRNWYLLFWTETNKQKKAAAENAIRETAEYEGEMVDQAANDRIAAGKKALEELKKNDEALAKYAEDKKNKAQAEYDATVAKLSGADSTITREYNRRIASITVDSSKIEADTKKIIDDATAESNRLIAGMYALYGSSSREASQFKVKQEAETKQIIDKANADKNVEIKRLQDEADAKKDQIRKDRDAALKDAENKMQEDLAAAQKKKDEAIASVSGSDNDKRIQAEKDFQEAATEIFMQAGRERIKINEEADKEIADLNKKTLQDWSSETSNILSKVTESWSSASSSISSIWNSAIDNELAEHLRAVDAMNISDEDRAAKVEALEHEAAEQRYEAEKFQYASNIAIATAQAALAVLNELSQGDIWSKPARAALAGVLGALQVAAVVAAKPQPPRFHGGGVVAGQGETTITAMAGETVTTPAQFKDIMAAFAQVARTGNSNGSGGTISMPVSIKSYGNVKVEQPYFDTNGMHLVIREEVNRIIGSGEAEPGFTQKSFRDAGVMIE
jgi:hypothetical protein